MSFIANLLALINWNVRRRTHRHGGDVRNASAENNDRPKFGLEFIDDDDLAIDMEDLSIARFETDPVRVTYVGSCGGRRDLAVDDPDAQADTRILDCIICQTRHQLYNTETL